MVIRTGPQTLSAYWIAFLQGRIKRSRIEPPVCVKTPAPRCSEVVRRSVTSAPVPEGQLSIVSDVLSRMRTNSCVSVVLTLVRVSAVQNLGVFLALKTLA